MSFEIKNATKEWKKVKPLLLTKTGVSEALRFLEAWDVKKITTVSQCKEWMSKLGTLHKFLATKRGEDRIKKHKKAFDFINKELPFELLRQTQFLGLAAEGEVLYDAVDKKWVAKSVMEKKNKERMIKKITAQGHGNKNLTAELVKKLKK